MSERGIACSRCGTQLDVVDVTYRDGNALQTAALCPSCKELVLRKRRVRTVRHPELRRPLVIAAASAVVAVLASLGLLAFGSGSSHHTTQRCVSGDAVVACVSS